MWAGLQIALTGVIGAVAVVAGVLKLYRSRLVWTRGKLPEPLLQIIAGLWFLFFFSMIVFLSVPFTPASSLTMAISALLWLTSIMLKTRPLWKARDRGKRRSAPLAQKQKDPHS